MSERARLFDSRAEEGDATIDCPSHVMVEAAPTEANGPNRSRDLPDACNNGKYMGNPVNLIGDGSPDLPSIPNRPVSSEARGHQRRAPQLGRVHPREREHAPCPAVSARWPRRRRSLRSV